MRNLLLLFFVLLGSACNAESSVKNIVFMISDDLKASVLGCYGDGICKTPNIDQLAKDGMLFQRAYCQGTSCGPSRTSFMHSRYKDGRGLNMGLHFRNHDWHTARVGKIYHMRVPGDIIAGTNGNDIASTWTQRFNSTGFEAHTPGAYACLNQNIFTDSLQNRESTKMKHRMFVTVQYQGDGSDQPDYKSATKAVELIREHKDKPFFLAVGFVRPHYPMVAPKQYFEPYPWQKIRLPESTQNDLDDIPKLGKSATRSDSNPIGKHPDNQKRMWQGYYASVTFMDQQVGRVVAELERLGIRDSTAIVFTSDHGYHLGEHGFWQKSNLHEEVLHVPLIIDAPNFDAGQTNSIVELVDLFPTCAELAGIPVPAKLHGKSLVPVLKDPQATVKDGALSLNRGFSFRTDRWHYMRYTDGTKELYDMTSDPREFTNLAGSDQYRDVALRLDEKLNRRLGDSGIAIESKKRKQNK